jgi:hypothetical protein
MEFTFKGCLMKLDIACTATKRPYIINQTFKSFTGKLFNKHDCRLIINIDPIGDDIDTDDVLDVCKIYFKEIVVNTPSEPNFYKAFQWVFSNCTSKYLYHLQDDWQLLKKVDLNKLVVYLEKYKNLACVRFPRGKKIPEGKKLDRNLYEFTKYYDQPALWKTEFYNEIMPYFNTNYGTEFQLRGLCSENSEDILRVSKKWTFGTYYLGRPIVKDLGRGWLKENNYTQKHCEEHGHLIRWEKNNGNDNILSAGNDIQSQISGKLDSNTTMV